MKYPKTRKPAQRGAMHCEECGCEVERRSAVQRYCRTCSTKKDMERKRVDHLKRGKARYDARKTQFGAKGRSLSAAEQKTIESSTPAMPRMAWYRRVGVPFSWAGSKNHIFSKRADGHVFMREESAYMRFELTKEVRNAMLDVEIAQNKLWIDIFVQKPTMRGDAVNFVDMVCDAVKDGVLLDDRWFSIRSVDWQIAKRDPMIFVGLGQESAINLQACSSCGRLLTFEKFQRNSARPNGIGLNCRECQAVARVSKKRDRAEAKLLFDLQGGIFG